MRARCAAFAGAAGADTSHRGLLAVLVAAVAGAGAGALIVIPTAGEIPILLGLAALAALAALGVSTGALGALLTLPALSLPSMATVGRTLTWRVVALTAGAVVLFGLLSSLVLWGFTSTRGLARRPSRPRSPRRRPLHWRCSCTERGPLAHRVERGTFNPTVPGSRPGRPTENAQVSNAEHLRSSPGWAKIG